MWPLLATCKSRTGELVWGRFARQFLNNSPLLATLNNAQVLVKQGSKLSMLVVIQIFLDLGAAYGAWVAGMP